MNVNCGALYFCMKEAEYLKATLISALSLRESNPCLPIRIVTDFPEGILPDAELFEHGLNLIHVPPMGETVFERTRFYRTKAIEYAFPQTLMIDSDTMPFDVSGIWQLLDSGVFYGSSAVGPTVAECSHSTEEEKLFTLSVIPSDYRHINAGVLLFRLNTAVVDLFNRWHEEWTRYKDIDQLALARALYTSRVDASELPEEYNTRYDRLFELSPQRRSAAKIIHYFGDQVRSGHFARMAYHHSPNAVLKSDTMFSKARL